MTRWNSTFHAWKRLLALRPYIEVLQSSLHLRPEADASVDGKRLKAIMITANEWAAIEDLVKILKPFDDVTTYMSASAYPTVSIVFPTVIALRDSTIIRLADSGKGKETAIRSENDEHAFDGELAYEDSPDDEDEPNRLKKRKIKINVPSDTSRLVERVIGAMTTLFDAYYPVSLIDLFVRSIDQFVRPIDLLFIYRILINRSYETSCSL